MYAFLFFLTYPIVWAAGWLPLKILYLVSDISYFIIYHVVKYRVKVVRANIKNSFPFETEKFRKKIERKFYRHLCDYGFETIRYQHFSQHEIKRRISFENTELLQQLFEKKKSIIALFGHYGNWEWVSSSPLWLREFGNPTLGTIYRPLKNPYYDQFFIKLRSRFGTQCVSKNNTLRSITRLHHEKQPFIFAFIADQTPSRNNLHFWTTFLNQETPFLTGWETIARKSNDSVVYMDIRKIKRGHYSCTFSLLCENPAESKAFELIEQYKEMMEQTILRNPAYWLWSHKRWKYKKSK